MQGFYLRNCAALQYFCQMVASHSVLQAESEVKKLPHLRITKRNRSMIIGLICGLGCALCVGLYIASVDEQAKTAQAEILARYGGEQVEVCVARRDIAAGETLADSDIETKTWIAALLPADAISVRGDAVGQQVGSTILAGEVISSKRFGFETADIEVPEGMSAISVPAKDVQAVGGALKAGMRCDVYAIGANATSKLASSVLVLTTSSTEDSASSQSTTWVTLAVEPSRVEEMVSAAQNLDLYFVLPSSVNSEGDAKRSGDNASGAGNSGSTADKRQSSSNESNSIDGSQIKDAEGELL